jgi:GNAT superfamily N-acetyltransferase
LNYGPRSHLRISITVYSSAGNYGNSWNVYDLILSQGNRQVMRIVCEHNSENLYKDSLIRNLVAYNDTKAPPERWEFLGLYPLDNDNRLIGGIQGNFEWDWLHIMQLWVKEPGKGLGRFLIEKAEAHAKARGKTGILLDTYEFQARHFYERFGFQVFGTIENAAGWNARYFMKKRIA